uniref:Transcription factor domain-containing protein n=1 Tax=Bionectria ochroleuca TaxID=29856 RepID=A0A0B7KQ49_BIOOC
MTPSAPALSSPLELCPVDAETVLKTFKELHLKSFPFICFEESISGTRLQHERPSLWLSIRIICCRSSEERRALDARFRESLGRRIFVDSERSMDLLLGIIAYLAWITDRIRDRKFLGVCSGVAASLVFDLRLDRVVAQENPYKETDIGRAYTYPIPQQVPSLGRTNEERRAVLACFCICTAISELLESPPMRWTSDMEASLQHLSSFPGVLQDRILVAIVKVFRIIDAVSAASTSRNIDMYAEREPKLPPAVYTSYLLNRLNSLKSALSPDILNEKTIRSYISYVEASINDLPLHRQASLADGNSWLDFRKAEHLHACLNACRQHLDNWSRFTIDELYCMSMPVHWYFARCTQILYRLSLMNDPSWDKKTR